MQSHRRATLDALGREIQRGDNDRETKFSQSKRLFGKTGSYRNA